MSSSTLWEKSRDLKNISILYEDNIDISDGQKNQSNSQSAQFSLKNLMESQMLDVTIDYDKMTVPGETTILKETARKLQTDDFRVISFDGASAKI